MLKKELIFIWKKLLAGLKMSKRITLPITEKFDEIKAELEAELGIEMTYHQIINILIHFYSTRTAQPKTQWRPIK